ncbi:transcription factor bHLH25-like [Chenopodium quinoa]|uniref:transcription factor bHLH25-like n=1 Tax=Chenopodium quinoa TaxID=63459 RepID=UPI000B778583|nr:transcription factor bHLH25-like [Chenopodium quinoa]
MESLQYNACVSSHSFASCTKDDHDYGEIGIVETPHLISFEVASKRLKSSSWNFSISDALRSPAVKDDNVPKENESRGCNKRTTRSMDSRSKLNLQYHVIAERRRRDILSQRLIALSALIPCLKKVTNLTSSI